MTATASLTQDEAAARAALVAVDRYDIAVDLTGLLEGDTVRSTSTISFRCTTPGATTFVDCVADIESATLNGVELDVSAADAGRLQLAGLAADNVLVVSAAQSETGIGAGILRTVDPTDKLVYVWTSFEPDDARRVWACFDQPDLKAPHRFTVTAPESWTVTSNCPPDSVEPADGFNRLWEFPDTPPLSTYVVVVNAGPFHELRSTRGGYDLGLYCRQSLAQFLDRDAEELFDLTDRGLAFFGERFGSPFPQPRYDQVFVPNMGGAMENWGCVTWTDAVMFRSPPSYSQRAMRASVLMHEMAHMWFGDLVTMTWWDDLWLNEAFASWASDWALAGATEEFSTAWAGFLAGLKREGYRQDMGPGTHPIRGDVPDVAQAMANFDAITYVKGQSVLRQLVAYVGEDAFVEGLRAYFRDHAYGNTRLADLMSAVGTASGRDLTSWTTAWFDRAGTDTLRLTDGHLEATGPDGDEPRPHRLDIASFTARDDALAPVGTTPVETAGPSTPVDLPEADLHLLNAGDLTFAAVRADDTSLRLLLDRAAELPDPTSRALVVTMAWDMLVKGELEAAQVVDTILGVLGAEQSPSIVEPFLALVLDVAEQWAPPAESAGLLGKVADASAALAGVPDHRQAALRTLAASATTDAHFALLDAAAGDDLDLAWRLAARRAELGEYDEAAIKLLVESDPDPDATVRALGVRGSLPDLDAKEAVWEAVLVDRSVPVGVMLISLGRRFWRPAQAELLEPFTRRYLDEVTKLNGGGMLTLGSIMKGMFPLVVADPAFVERAREIAARPETHPAVRTTLVTGADTLARKLRSRSSTS